MHTVHCTTLLFAALFMLGTSVLVLWAKHTKDGLLADADNEVLKQDSSTDIFQDLRVKRHGADDDDDDEEHECRDCQDVLEHKEKGWTKSGVYTIHPKGWKSMKVYCDMDTDGGGWTLFQHRIDGSVNFYRTWSEYKNGFGKKQEFWLGNENIHRILAQGKYKLRINMNDFSGKQHYAEYSNFVVSNEENKYRLNIDVGSYKGTAGTDQLGLNNNMKFSTKDEDNDVSKINCATQCHGAWWYSNCTNANPNGKYAGQQKEGKQYNTWLLGNRKVAMKATSMMMRKQ